MEQAFADMQQRMAALEVQVQEAQTRAQWADVCDEEVTRVDEIVMISNEDERSSAKPEVNPRKNHDHIRYTDKVEVEYPIGHRRRREESLPLLQEKFRENLASRFPRGRCERILATFGDQAALEATPVHEFLDWFVI